MISETFLDKILDLYFCKKVDSYYDETIVRNDIVVVLTYAKNKDLPIKILPKFELVEYITTKIDWEKTTPDLIIENISSFGKFSQFYDSLKYKTTMLLDSVRCKSILEMLQVKKEGIIIEEDKHLLVDFLDKFESGDFTGGEEMIKTYEDLISTIYIRTLLKKRYDDKVNTNEFVLEDENSFDECLKLIEKNNDPKSKIKTGFQNFDKNILKGGLENGRIYIFGGTPGVGKSIALLNFLCSSAFNEDNGDGLYFYFTLENFIGESLERTLRMLPYYDKTSSPGIDKENAKNMFKYLEKSNKKIVMKYLLPYSSNINDAMIYMDEMISKTGLKPKLAVFDYLDLFASINKTDMYRLELGYITMEQKMVGIKYGIPTITATQLNSEGYNSKTPGLGSVTESRKKAEHADFIGLLQADMVDNLMGNNLYNLTMHIKKNRNGPLGCANFNIDYSKMLIKESGISMFTKPEKKNDPIVDFSTDGDICHNF